MSGESPIPQDRNFIKEGNFYTPIKFVDVENDRKNSGQEILNFGSNLRNAQNSASKCCISQCSLCSKIDFLQRIAVSPSVNYLCHSPHSLEKYLESFSRERINVMKLVNRKHDKKDEIIYKSKINSRTGSENKMYRPETENQNLDKIVETLFSEKIFVKKNLMFLFDGGENNYIQNENEMLFRKKEREVSEEIDLFKKNAESNCNSPKVYRKNSEGSQNNFSSSKKKIFLCSDQKSTLNDSLRKSVCGTTISSIEKKEKRRIRKSSHQLDALKITYEKSSNKDWNKETITEISNKIGLSENKVYKWLWDKKNKEMMDKKIFFIQTGKHYSKV